MSGAVRYLGWLALLAGPVLLAQPAQIKRAAAGEVATGEVINNQGDQLQLAVNPCGPNHIVVVFQRPYTVEPAGSVSCNGQQKSLVQVVKQ
jgi:hypothetical protein